MKSLKNLLVTGIILLACGTFPLTASAESASDFGASGLSAAARLNLRVIIPGFLFFRVGTVGGTADTIEFDMTACVTGGSCTVGDGTPFTTGTGGDAGGSGANVSVFSNVGQITITPTNDTTNGLEDGANSISLDEITTATDNGSLPAPALNNSGGTVANPSLTGSTSVTAETAVWTYRYENTTVPAPGSYEAEITYTATSL